MKKKDYFLSKLFKRLKSAPADSSEEISQLIDSIESSEENDEFTQEDIEALLKERDDLKDEIERLKAELEQKDAELKACKEAAEEQVKEAETAAIEEALKACVDKACPMNQTVAEDMLKSFDRSQLSMDAGVIKGLDEQEAAVLKRYEGLYGKKFSTPSASKELPKVSFGKKVDVTNSKKSFNDRVNAMVENN
jgi:chromosome segregation ATPase